MSVRGATSLGIGAMVGAGIFTLLGEAGAIAGSAVWMSVLLGGSVAELLGYVVAKLGSTYPSSGGLLAFVGQGFGMGHLAGVLSWMLYFAVIIVTAMVSLSFGTYAAALLASDDASTTLSLLLTIAAVLGLALIQILGSKLVDRLASSIVVILLAVLAIFIVLTVSNVDREFLAPRPTPSQATSCPASP
jgi:amino acid transporter